MIKVAILNLTNSSHSLPLDFDHTLGTYTFRGNLVISVNEFTSKYQVQNLVATASQVIVCASELTDKEVEILKLLSQFTHIQKVLIWLLAPLKFSVIQAVKDQFKGVQFALTAEGLAQKLID